jgi:hypothetical protein
MSVLNRASFTIVQLIADEELEPDYFLVHGLMELKAILKNNPYLDRNELFHIADERYQEVCQYLEKVRGMDLTEFRKKYEEMIEKQGISITIARQTKKRKYNERRMNGNGKSTGTHPYKASLSPLEARFFLPNDLVRCLIAKRKKKRERL